MARNVCRNNFVLAVFVLIGWLDPSAAQFAVYKNWVEDRGTFVCVSKDQVLRCASIVPRETRAGGTYVVAAKCIEDRNREHDREALSTVGSINDEDPLFRSWGDSEARIQYLTGCSGDRDGVHPVSMRPQLIRSPPVQKPPSEMGNKERHKVIKRETKRMMADQPTQDICTSEVNCDYPGNDITSTSSRTVDACAKDCNDNPECVAFALGRSCWLKRTAGTRVTINGAICGVCDKRQKEKWMPERIKIRQIFPEDFTSKVNYYEPKFHDWSGRCEINDRSNDQFVKARCTSSQYLYSISAIRAVCQTCKENIRNEEECKKPENRIPCPQAVDVPEPPDIPINIVPYSMWKEGNDSREFLLTWNSFKMAVEEDRVDEVTLLREIDDSAFVAFQSVEETQVAPDTCASLVISIDDSRRPQKVYERIKVNKNFNMLYVHRLELPVPSYCRKDRLWSDLNDGIRVEEICYPSAIQKETLFKERYYFHYFCLTLMYTMPVITLKNPEEQLCENSELTTMHEKCAPSTENRIQEVISAKLPELYKAIAPDNIFIQYPTVRVTPDPGYWGCSGYQYSLQIIGIDVVCGSAICSAVKYVCSKCKGPRTSTTRLAQESCKMKLELCRNTRNSPRGMDGAVYDCSHWNKIFVVDIKPSFYPYSSSSDWNNVFYHETRNATDPECGRQYLKIEYTTDLLPQHVPLTESSRKCELGNTCNAGCEGTIQLPNPRYDETLELGKTFRLTGNCLPTSTVCHEPETIRVHFLATVFGATLGGGVKLCKSSESYDCETGKVNKEIFVDRFKQELRESRSCTSSGWD